MFFRSKRSGPRTYLQIVENRREGDHTRQRVIATLGRLDQLQASGPLEALLGAGARFAEAILVLTAHARGEAPTLATRRIGPPRLFERLWVETGCCAVIESLVAGRKYGFSVERAIFLTVLHWLVAPGSDRSADQWRRDYAIEDTERLALPPLCRAMAWLGEPLPEQAQAAKTPFSPCCTKDVVEGALFTRCRDLFSALEVVFFDTTLLSFEGNGGETLGHYGHSKDPRPDLQQLVVGAVLDVEGRPVCCEVWPGTTTAVKTLVPIVERLGQRFAIRQVCIVADRGMISQETLAEVEARGWRYVLGARLRSQKEVCEEVLARAGRYRRVPPKGQHAKDPAPLKVKEVRVAGRRYVICFNEDQAKQDAADRQAIVAALRDQLRHADKALVGNRGYRKYLKSDGPHFQIDDDKLAKEARYDGKWVLRTNTSLDAAEVALKYKQLGMVEALFRSAKSLLNPRPVFHQRDDTLRGQGFCSFLALVLHQELQARRAAKGHTLPWQDVINDLDELQEVEIEHQQNRFLLRTEVKGTCGKVFQAAGVGLPPAVQQLPQGQHR